MILIVLFITGIDLKFNDYPPRPLISPALYQYEEIYKIACEKRCGIILCVDQDIDTIWKLKSKARSLEMVIATEKESIRFKKGIYWFGVPKDKYVEPLFIFRIIKE